MLLIGREVPSAWRSAMTTDAFAGSLTIQTRPVVLRSLGDVSVAPDTPSPWVTALRASCLSWPSDGRPRPPPNRVCSSSTSRWPPSSAWTQPGWAGRTGCDCSSATWFPTGRRRWPRHTPDTSSAATFPRLGDGRALLLGELSTTDGYLRDLHLKGSGATPFARGGDGLAAVGPMLREYIVSEADARDGHPDHPGARRRGDGAPGAAGYAAAGCCARPCREQPSAGRHLPVRRGRRRPRPAAPTGRSRHRSALPGRGVGREPLPRAVRGRRVAAGGAGGAVDARRVRARSHEHGQRDDIRRDHRLRAVRLHGRPTTRRRCSARSTRGAATPTATNRRSRSGTSPASPRPAATALPKTRSGPSTSRRRASAASARSSRPPWRPACGPSSASPDAVATRWRRR